MAAVKAYEKRATPTEGWADRRVQSERVQLSVSPELEPIVRLLAEKRWPFRIHATYDESISKVLSVFERVNVDIPLRGPHWLQTNSAVRRRKAG